MNEILIDDIAYGMHVFPRFKPVDCFVVKEPTNAKSIVDAECFKFVLEKNSMFIVNVMQSADFAGDSSLWIVDCIFGCHLTPLMTSPQILVRCEYDGIFYNSPTFPSLLLMSSFDEYLKAICNGYVAFVDDEKPHSRSKKMQMLI